MATPSSRTEITPPPRSPQFFKIYLPQLCSERLKIPPVFLKHIDGWGTPNAVVSLKGPGGGICYSNLVKDSGELFFDKGWKEFVHDHAIQVGDFLVFRYEGNFNFNVLVFDATACEKETAFLARQSQDDNATILDASKDNDVTILDTSKDGDNIREEEALRALEESRNGSVVTQKRKRGRPRKNTESFDCIVIEGPGMVDTPKRKRGRPRKNTESKRGRPRKSTGSDDCIVLKGPGIIVTPKRKRGRPRKDTRSDDCIVLEGPVTKKLSGCGEESCKSNPKGEHVANASSSSTMKTPLSFSSEKLNKSIITNASVLSCKGPSTCLALVKSGQKPQTGEVVLSSKKEVVPVMMKFSGCREDSCKSSPNRGQVANGSSSSMMKTPLSSSSGKLNKSIITNASVLSCKGPSTRLALFKSGQKPQTGEAVLSSKKEVGSVMKKLSGCGEDSSKSSLNRGHVAHASSSSTMKTPLSSSSVKLNKSIITNASVLSCKGPLSLVKSGQKPLTGEAVLNSKQRVGLKSQRRPVTQEELDIALEKAKAFKSEHPFFTIKMQNSYVYLSFFLRIPGDFPTNHLPKGDRRLILWDPNGEAWEVRSVPCEGNRCALSAGWGSFSYGNNLETGDVCVFELIKKYQFMVHIFRVVEELTPCIRQL